MEGTGEVIYHIAGVLGIFTVREFESGNFNLGELESTNSGEFGESDGASAAQLIWGIPDPHYEARVRGFLEMAAHPHLGILNYYTQEARSDSGTKRYRIRYRIIGILY
jgi:hypothetical protein